MLNQLETEGVECCRKLHSGKEVKKAIGLLLNARSLLTVCVKVLHQVLLVSILMLWS